MVARVSIQQLSARLRDRRRRLVGFEQRSREGWSTDLEAYDRDLLEAAAMLDVPAPPDPAVPLSASERAELEEGLARAGLQVRTDAI